MLSQKNLSPQQLSALTAFIIAVPISIGIYVFKPVWWIALSSFAVIFLGSFGLILFTLQRFIYRKIKLIYKFIYQTKASKKEEFYNKELLPQKGIEEVSQDVQQWAEQRREEIELLQKNEQFRREFLQNLSHEIKTPIFAIQGYVDTLLTGAIENPAVSKKFLESTSRNIERLVSLVSGISEISKLESGEELLVKEQFVIQDLVKEIYDEFEIIAAQKQIKLVIKKGCEYPPLTVYADKEKIRQVVNNLIDNAIKYTNTGNEVESSFYKTDGKHILIEISDNGEGIEEEHLPRIFERFYRTDLARSRKVGGSGLGLAICKHIIEAHGQNIHVRSKTNVGSTFGFTLDAKKDD